MGDLLASKTWGYLALHTDVLLQDWPVIVLVLVIGVGLGFLVSRAILRPRYEGAIEALKAHIAHLEAQIKSPKSGQSGVAPSRGLDRLGQIRRLRSLTSAMAIRAGTSDTVSMKELEPNSLYLAVRQHLSEDFLTRVHRRGRMVMMPADGSTVPPLASLIWEELDRLEREWRAPSS